MIDADTVLESLRNPHVRRKDDQTRWLRDGGAVRVRIGEPGIGNDVLDESAWLVVQEIGDGDWSTSVVEHADAGADDIGLLRARGVRDRRARSVVVRIPKVVLPVVAHAVRQRDAR